MRSLPAGRLLRTIPATPFVGFPLAFSPDGSKLAVKAYSKVQVWDVGSGSAAAHPRGPHRCRHDRGLVTGRATAVHPGLDRQLLAWDLAGDSSFVRTATIDAPSEVGSVWVAGDTVVAGTFGGQMLFVNRADGSVTRPQETTGSEVVSTVRSGGSSSLVVATNCDGTVSVWDAAGGRRLGVVDLPRLDPAADCQTWVASNGVTAATIRTPGGPLDLIDVPSRAVRPVTMRLPAGHRRSAWSAGPLTGTSSWRQGALTTGSPAS